MSCKSWFSSTTSTARSASRRTSCSPSPAPRRALGRLHRLGRRRRPVAALKKYGAEKVYVVDDAEIKGYLVAPKAEVLQQLVEKTLRRRRVLISSSYEGKEIAGRLAIKIESGLITDAVDVQPTAERR